MNDKPLNAMIKRDRFYYSATIQDFLHLDRDAILGHITQKSQ